MFSSITSGANCLQVKGSRKSAQEAGWLQIGGSQSGLGVSASDEDFLLQSADNDRKNVKMALVE